MAVSILGRKFFMGKTPQFYQQIRTGYIVLLPEISPHQTDTNPLYKNGLPDGENLNNEKCISTLGKYVLDFEHSVREVENSIVENKDELDLFANVVEPLEESGSKLEVTWGLCKALYLTESTIMPPSKYILMHNRARKARSMKYNSKHIYNMFKTCDSSKLSEEEQRVVDKFLIEGKLNGLELSSDKLEQTNQILVSLENEKDKFRRRTQISMRKFKHSIRDPVLIQNFPERTLRVMSQDKSDFRRGPWDVTLSRIADDVLSYCPDRNVRWNTWMARRQVASGYSGQSSELNNSETLEKIRSLRRDLAKVLGYDSFIHMSMETKMAGSLDTVQSTLDKLLERAQILQESEMESLQKFAESEGFRGRLEMWDVPYWEREQKIKLFGWDEKKMCEYFPLEKVFEGLLSITSKTFGLRFTLAKTQTWHPDVKLYHISSSESMNPIAGLYVDLYSRKDKLFSWEGSMVGIRPVAKILDPTEPLAALVFNFPRPKSDKEVCLLDFSSVESLFKKFGQALQQLLSHVNYSEVSGLSNIEWDAVEVVSNFMYLWLKDADVLKEISGHYKTGEALPQVELEQIRKHMAGFHLCNEIYLANLDIQLHTSKEFWAPLVKNLWRRHFAFGLEANDAHPLSFLTSVSGELSGAYYSRLWSRMLAEDAYNSFKTDPDRESTGLRFRDTFLGFGGACHPSEVFRRFQGRDASSEAFEEFLSND